MFEILKKYISNNTGILIRLDDIAENMNWELMEKSEAIFDKFKIKPVLGVIPNNKDSHLLSYPKKKGNFWDQVRSWKNKGWEIVMHGDTHVYDKFGKKNDYFGYGGGSEFYGHSYEIQITRIKNGLNKFKDERIFIRAFFAPNHTYDKNTFLALKKCGINQVIDGYGLMPYEENEIKFIPQLFHKVFAIPFGIQTTQIHLNYFSEKDFENFETFIKQYAKKIITYDQALKKLNNKLIYKVLRITSKKILQVKRIIKS